MSCHRPGSEGREPEPSAGLENDISGCGRFPKRCAQRPDRFERCPHPRAPAVPAGAVSAIRGGRSLSGVPTLELLSADALRSTVVAYRDAVRAHQRGIDRLNVYPVPDGDTGTNMARTLDAVVDELDRLAQVGQAGRVEGDPAGEPGLGPTCDAISHGSLMGARGNSGVILSQILRGLTGTLRDAGEATGARVADALAAASAAAYQAVLKPIEGTILTVARAAADGA
ncbi:MAG: DAK2 domain-containing protein, partial [Actinobacteria bacterium]|nr:DAK2 domain-containing protein [Actinomycetota bacterium]